MENESSAVPKTSLETRMRRDWRLLAAIVTSFGLFAGALLGLGFSAEKEAQKMRVQKSASKPLLTYVRPPLPEIK